MSSDDEEVVPPPPRRKSSPSASAAAARRQQLEIEEQEDEEESEEQLHNDERPPLPVSSNDDDNRSTSSGPTLLSRTVPESPAVSNRSSLASDASSDGGGGDKDYRDPRLRQIIRTLTMKLDMMWPAGIDAKTKLKWINNDANVAKKAYEVLSLASNESVVRGEASRFNGDFVGAREYIVLKARLKQREQLMEALQKSQLGILASFPQTGEKQVVCEGPLTKMALSGKNSWKKRHFRLIYALPPRYAGPWLEYYEDDKCHKEKGRVQLSKGDMVELQPAAGKSRYGFAILAKTHEIKIKGYASTEEDLNRWVGAFNACINAFMIKK